MFAGEGGLSEMEKLNPLCLEFLLPGQEYHCGFRNGYRYAVRCVDERNSRQRHFEVYRKRMEPGSLEEHLADFSDFQNAKEWAWLQGA